MSIPQLVALLVLPVPQLLRTFYTSFVFFVVLSQETHRQAHMVRPARWVRTVQKSGLIVSQKTHLAHHHSPFDDNYCILSGMWNNVLDRTRFFRRWEAIIYRTCGVEPLCWGLQPELRTEALRLIEEWWPSSEKS